MNRQCVSLTSVLILIGMLLAPFGSALAQVPVAAGVTAGDMFTYDLTFGWESTIPGQAPPAYLVEQNQTDYYQVRISNVMTTTVELITIWRFKNGTEVAGAEQVELSTGMGNSILVYAANLSAGGKLYPNSDLPWVINETVPRLYQKEFREANHIVVNNTGVEGEVYSYISLFFDRQTGVVVESTVIDVYTANPSQTFTRHVVIKDSTAWAIPEFPSALAVTVLVAALTAAVVVWKRKGSKAVG
ncbi:MAG: hypothetical protein ACE14S_10925 [Candidatus Bathyarchaeia archaeon]